MRAAGEPPRHEGVLVDDRRVARDGRRLVEAEAVLVLVRLAQLDHQAVLADVHAPAQVAFLLRQRQTAIVAELAET